MSGADATGARWRAVPLASHNGTAYRLDRNGREYVRACGTRTLATLTTRYAITWEN